MPANAQVYQTTAIGAASPAFASEAIIATLPSVNIDLYGANIRFLVGIGATAGADTSALVFRVRRNNVTGAIVGAAVSFPVQPAVARQFPVFVDGNEPVGQRSYVLTVEQTAASANATINNVSIVGIVGN